MLRAMTRALVIHASKRGSTAEIAEVVAETLRTCGVDADCRPVAEVRGLEGYDAVVLGSAVYMRRWRPEAKRFLRRHADELVSRPFWIFSSGPVGEPIESRQDSWLEPPRVVALAEELGARGHVVFGGRVPAHPRGPLERRFAESMPEAYRDRRDWRMIRRWAAGVADEMLAAQPTGQPAASA